MTNENQDIRPVYRGDSIEIRVTVVNDDGEPRDITADNILFTLAESNGAEPVIERDDTDTLVTHDDPTNGVLSVRLTSEDTKSLDAHVYVYHITLYGTDDVATVTTGTIYMKEGYTHD